MSNSEYLYFVQQVFPNFPEGRRVSIIASVDSAKESEFVLKMRNNPEIHFDKFDIFDYKNSQKITPPTANNNAFTVIQYTYPKINSVNFYGRNITLNSPLGEKLFDVVSNQKPMISSFADAIKPVTKKPFFLYFYPILKPNELEGEKLSGIVTSSQSISDLFSNQVIKESLEQFDYVLTDDKGNQFLYPQQIYIPSAKNISTKPNGILYRQSIEIIGNQWELTILPKLDLLKGANDTLNSILLLGVFISILLSILSKLIYSQQERLSLQVSLKTKDLNKTLEQVNKQQSQLKVQNLQLESAVSTANQAVKVKSEFLANMSHEIRTPLNGIVGLTQILKQSNLNPSQFEYITKMEYSTKHLMTVINDILDFSKVESGHIELEQAPMSIHSVIDFMKANFEEVTVDKGIDFKVNLDKKFHPDLMGDLVRVNQILLNLCSNAIKFTERGSVVVNISMDKQENSKNDRSFKAIFEVVDTGIGMSQEVVSNLFQAFTQADTSTTRRFGGTGLGLTISQKLCQLMNGDITVTSEPNVGSRFKAEVILHQNDQVLIADEPVGMLDSSLEILIIDDNLISLKTISQFVMKMGVKVVTTELAEHGLSQIIQNPNKFKIVLLDWTLPNMDGEKFTQELVKLNLEQQPIIIVISAYDIKLIEKKSRNLPISAILQKPCSEKVLYDTIKMKLENTPEVLNKNIVADLSGLHILIAEDNAINQLVINKLLTAEGVYVEMVTDGKQCINKLETSSRFDLVLMDIHMPIMDGVETTKRIRKHSSSSLARIPIVALTANVLQADIDSYLKLGMDGYASKPVNIKELSKEILRVLSLTNSSTEVLPPI